jgi:hypothetical protein
MGVYIDEVLFNNLVLFAYGGLHVYWERFEGSERFKGLQREVKRQERLYQVLNKYQLIQN